MSWRKIPCLCDLTIHLWPAPSSLCQTSSFAAVITAIQEMHTWVVISCFQLYIFLFRQGLAALNIIFYNNTYRSAAEYAGFYQVLPPNTATSAFSLNPFLAEKLIYTLRFGWILNTTTSLSKWIQCDVHYILWRISFSAYRWIKPEIDSQNVVWLLSSNN